MWSGEATVTADAAEVWRPVLRLGASLNFSERSVQVGVKAFSHPDAQSPVRVGSGCRWRTSFAQLGDALGNLPSCGLLLRGRSGSGGCRLPRVLMVVVLKVT